MKVTRLQLREKLLSAMEEINDRKFEREKFTEEKARAMVNEAWELHRNTLLRKAKKAKK